METNNRRMGWQGKQFAAETGDPMGQQQCTKSEASLLCRSRLQLALVRGLARQLERGFPLPQSQPARVNFKYVFSF